MIPEPKRVKIIAELCNQHKGSMRTLETMVLQAKLNGADFVKVQLFSSVGLFGNRSKEHLEFTKDEFSHIVNFARSNGIEIFASVFDEKRLEWCVKNRMLFYKIASRTFGTPLCDKIIAAGSFVFISNGEHPYDFRYKKSYIIGPSEKIVHFYCIPKYPTLLSEVKFPSFYSLEHPECEYQGYSDHSLGITAAKVAVVKGARFIEKHFTLNKNLQGTELGHLGAMTPKELSELRRFCDEYIQIPS